LVTRYEYIRIIDAKDPPQATLRPPTEGHASGTSSDRERWQERRHRAAPGTDWRAMDAATRAAQRAANKRQSGDKAAQIVISPTLSGDWQERASSTVTGRIEDAVFDLQSNRLHVISAGGNLWSANLEAPAWTLQHDDLSMRTRSLTLAQTPNGPRLLVPSGFLARDLVFGPENARSLMYSDDGGVTWIFPTGFPEGSEFYGAVPIVFADPAQPRGYYLRRQRLAPPGATTTYSAELSLTNDFGSHFELVSNFPLSAQSGALMLFSPPFGSDAVYLLRDNVVARLDPASGMPQTLATLWLGADLPRLRGAISGGVDAAGAVFLWVQLEIGETRRLFRSRDGGLTWNEPGTSPSRFFTPRGFCASASDPDTLYIGEVDLHRTHDGGAHWQSNHWYQYVLDPQHLLHADIQSVSVARDAAGTELVLASTDGGTYASTDGMATANNLTTGVRNAQYYSSYTPPRHPDRVYLGSQDQGLQLATGLSPLGASGSEVLYGGDESSLASNDGGRSLWGVSQEDLFLIRDTAHLGQLPVMDFPLPFAERDFLPPLALIDDGSGGDALVAGGAGSVRSRLVRAHFNPSDPFVLAKTELAYDFGSLVSAVAIPPNAPSQWYAITEPADNGAAATLFKSTDAGRNWQRKSGSFGDAADYFRATSVVLDPATQGRVYVGGSGYSNPAVFVSNDDGASFAPMSAGLPTTLVNKLAISADGQWLFAAADTGPYFYDRSQSRWTHIAGTAAPDQIYYSVEFIEPTRTARFVTYGRGAWDFQVAADDLVALDHHGITGAWYNPATSGQGLTIEVFPDVYAPGTGILSAGWFTFSPGAAGGEAQQRWYSLQGAAKSTRTPTVLTIYRNVGGRFGTPPATTASAVGTAILRLTDCTHGELSYSFTDGSELSGSMPLARLTADAECRADASHPTPNAEFALSGSWYDPQSSGQGLIVEVSPGTPIVFAGWYTYAPNAANTAGPESQRWYSLQIPFQSGQRNFAQVPIYRTIGGRFDQPATSAQTTVQVGSADLQFVDCNHLRVAYAFTASGNQGLSGTLDLTRAGPVPAGCVR
jgi:hypothetical protein